MATLTVQPRHTPPEKHESEVDIPVDETLAVFTATIDDWVTPRQPWDLQLREGTEFGRTNNVEVHVLFAAGEQSSSVCFRLDQLEAVEDNGSELYLRFEERDGIAKVVFLTATGVDVELFHILTYT